jgi:glycosyltransferase involved in cell wall biosynthesis
LPTAAKGIERNVPLTLFILVVAAADFGLALGIAYLFLIKDRNAAVLEKLPPPRDQGVLPLVSLVAAARNESRNIEAAVESLLQLDYPRLEITLVNDRSTDGTGVILDRLARQNPQLNVVHINDLPAGWLGKNHALHCGAERSRGDWLLFTDADVIFEPTTLSRAMSYALEQKVDHLVSTPQCLMPSWLLQAFVLSFSYLFTLYTRPWKVRDPASDAHIGVGAFNMIRAGVYRGLGGHRQIAMRPDDDLKLGKLVKLHGFRQDIVIGRNMVLVEWYTSVGEMVRGLEKNMFAGLEYDLGAVVASTILVFVTTVLPFIAWPFVAWPAAGLFLATALLYLGLAWYGARLHGLPDSCALAFPLGIVTFLLIQWRSTLLTLWQNGIQWRGTRYSLMELRANRV